MVRKKKIKNSCLLTLLSFSFTPTLLPLPQSWAVQGYGGCGQSLTLCLPLFPHHTALDGVPAWDTVIQELPQCDPYHGLQFFKICSNMGLSMEYSPSGRDYSSLNTLWGRVPARKPALLWAGVSARSLHCSGVFYGLQCVCLPWCGLLWPAVGQPAPPRASPGLLGNLSFGAWSALCPPSALTLGAARLLLSFLTPLSQQLHSGLFVCLFLSFLKYVVAWVESPSGLCLTGPWII